MRRLARVNTASAGRLVSHSVSWSIGGAPRLDAAAPREAEDQLAFRLRDATFGPRHLNDRHERQQNDGIGREAQVVQLLDELRVIEPGLAAEVLAGLLGGSGLTRIFSISSRSFFLK